MALLLLLFLGPELIPCTAPCNVACSAPGAPPCLSRLRVCGNGDLATSSLADQAILRSEAAVPLPPRTSWNEPFQADTDLSEGHTPPVYRPPRVRA